MVLPPDISVNQTKFPFVRKGRSIIFFLIGVFLLLCGAVVPLPDAAVYGVLCIGFCFLVIIFGVHCDGGRLRL